MASRNVVFSDIGNKFEAWLNSQGIDGSFASAAHYRKNLEAIGKPIQPHAVVGAPWNGFYELLTGERPTVGVFEVHSVAEFAAQYGRAARFFSVEKKPNQIKEQIRSSYPSCSNFDDLFEFAYTIHGDGGHTRKGYQKYCQFICELESEVDKPVVSARVGKVNGSLQSIYYGAPGTGKSHDVDKEARRHNGTVRTTFHPDSDYSTFVGAYKPKMESGKIVYAFSPQAFTKAYEKAWKKWWDESLSEEDKVQFLVIEEINRGNCAQIFGDLFQLLDRGDDGWSTYPIEADSDLAEYLAGKTQTTDQTCPSKITAEEWTAIGTGEKLALPPNLYIWATMNTSDQSLFPIDSAFKRRWEWKYVPISEPDDPNWIKRKISVGGECYDWWKFLQAINPVIREVTGSEDKQLGYFFVKADKATGEISVEKFANKVLFYLYGDVFKSYELPAELFKKSSAQNDEAKLYSFQDFFYTTKTEVVKPDGTTVTKKPGDVKEEAVLEILKNLGVPAEPKPAAPATPSAVPDTPPAASAPTDAAPVTPSAAPTDAAPATPPAAPATTDDASVESEGDSAEQTTPEQ